MDRPAFDRHWGWKCAGLGGTAWVVLLGGAARGYVALGPFDQFFLLAPLVVVPLGLMLAAPDASGGWHSALYRAGRFLQPLGAAGAVASFWLSPGVPAAGLASGWLGVSALLGLSGLFRFLRRRTGPLSAIRKPPSTEACFIAGLLFLPVGATWLVLSRGGAHPMGFTEPIVLLTAVHFHFAGFAATIMTGAAGRVLCASLSRLSSLFRIIAGAVIAGIPLLAAGFVISPWLKLGAALLLAASLSVLAGLTLWMLPAIRPRRAQVLLALSAGSLLVGMVFAALYAVGELREHFLIGISQMVPVHGAVNALGVAVCGLWGWNLAGGATLSTSRHNYSEGWSGQRSNYDGTYTRCHP